MSSPTASSIPSKGEPVHVSGPARNAGAVALRSLLLVFATLALSACMGQHMAMDAGDEAEVVSGAEVRMVQITPQVVAQLESASTQAQVPQELASYQPESYEIAPGDTLLVTVWDHPEITTPAGNQQQAVTNGRLVYPDGTLFFPYVGKVQVAGKSIAEVRTMLTEQLAEYIERPQLDVNVVSHGGQVSLQGAFVDTAPQPITTRPLTLSQAIGAAGINAEQADLAGLVLIRDGQRYALDLDALSRNEQARQEIYLKPGDRLFLPYNDRKEVYVLGEVLRPQAITFKTTSMNLAQALGRVGGLDQRTSDGDAVYVIRGVEDLASQPATVYQLDASSPAAYVLADRFEVQPGDVVFVGAAGITRWNRFLTQLLPLTGLLRNAVDVDADLGRN